MPRDLDIRLLLYAPPTHPGYVPPAAMHRFTCSICGTTGIANAPELPEGWSRWGNIEETQAYACDAGLPGGGRGVGEEGAPVSTPTIFELIVTTPAGATLRWVVAGRSAGSLWRGLVLPNCPDGSTLTAHRELTLEEVARIIIDEQERVLLARVAQKAPRSADATPRPARGD